MTNTQTGAPHLTDVNFAETINNKEGKPVFVDFYADWCGPCKAAAPVIEKLAVEYADKVIIAKIDVDANNATSAEHGVLSIPTVVVFKDGKEVDRIVGYPGEGGYRKSLDKVLA